MVMVGVGVGVGDDHFSFPVVSNPVVSNLSTPLWRIASRVYHHDEAAEKAGDKVEGSIVLEGSALEDQSRREGIEEVESVEEEKIDMLWEDFFCKEEKPPTEAILMEEESHGKPSSLTRPCLPSGGRAPLGGGLVALVAVVKLLKKMFLIRNNSAHHHPQVENKR